ncbi:MAG: PaaI family thioesterase [Nitrospirota bacterium]|nr:MAG: PaaI family thioesterase [Nitrospirota bacterium]
MRPEISDDGQCFVCGKDNPKGLGIEFRSSEEGVVAEFIASAEHQGYRNIVHGGIIAALLDEASIKAASSSGITAVTAEIRLRYKNPLFINEHAIIKAKIVRERGDLIEAEAFIRRSDDSKMIARCSTKLYVQGE